MSGRKVVGASVPRIDGVAKVTGAARFASDLTLPGMLHGRIARSTRAHARLVSIHAEDAMRVRGVVRVVTARDLMELVPYYGHIVLDHPILAVDTVRFQGEPLALVVADTREAAAEAADQVWADYQDLESVVDAEAALRPEAPVLHPVRGRPVGDEGFDPGGSLPTGNICAEYSLAWGDLGAAFASADLVLEADYRYPMLYGYAMEPYNALAAFEQGDLVVYSSAQHPYMVRNDLSRIFGLPLARVRVVVPYVGGGYGTKSYTKVEPLASVAAWLLQRPVQVQLSVEESILTTRSDSALIRARSAFTRDGRLLGRDMDIILNSGAYTDNSPLVAQKALNRCFGPYRMEALRARVRAVFTNTVPASSLRGFGAPQGNLGGETQMDEAADRLGIDPVRLRMLNLVGPGEEILPGKRGVDADLAADLDQLAEALGWPRPGPGLNAGFGLSASDAGAFPVSTVMVRIHADGSASTLTGATELGQGSRTVMAQIVAEELGLEMGQVAVVASDTGVTPYERTTGASRTTTLAGRALIDACKDARRQIREAAAEAEGVAVSEVEDAPGGVRVGGRLVGYGEALRRWFGAEAEISGSGLVRRAGDFQKMPPFWEIGCSGVLVGVDEETGVVSVEKLVTLGDVGFAINPALVEGQDAGAATMGLGAALHEQLVYDGDMLLNSNVVDYRVPRFHDTPREMTHLLVQRGDGSGPYGAKGGGEGAGNPIGGAIASAIGRATGRYPRELPLTPERVWRLFKEDDGDQD